MAATLDMVPVRQQPQRRILTPDTWVMGLTEVATAAMARRAAGTAGTADTAGTR